MQAAEADDSRSADLGSEEDEVAREGTRPAEGAFVPIAMGKLPVRRGGERAWTIGKRKFDVLDGHQVPLPSKL